MKISNSTHKTIMLVTPVLNLTGVPRVVSLLANELQKKYRVLVVVFEHSNNLLDLDTNVEVINLHTPFVKKGRLSKLLMFWKRVFKLARQILKHEPCKIITFSESANFVGIFAALIIGKRKLVSVSIHDAPAYLDSRYKKLFRAVYSLPSRVLCVSRGIMSTLATDYKIAPNKLAYVKNPCQLNGGSSSKKETDIFKPYILGVGRLNNQKGFDILIRSYAKVADALGVNLVIIGEGPRRAELENLVSDLGVGSRVFLVGEKVEMAPYYAMASLFVLSSRHEGWPIVLMEAMLHKVPVIAADCPTGPAELIRNDKNGILVAKENVDELAGAIIRLYSDKKKSSELVHQAYLDVQQHLPSAVIADWLVEPVN